MTQTPLSDSPIFNQLDVEFAAKGTSYDDLVNWSVPVFEWGPRHVVQLDKQKTNGVRITKDPSIAAPPLSESSQRMVEQVAKMDMGTFGMGLPVKVQPLSAKVLTSQVHSDVLEANGIEVPKITGINDRPELLGEYKKVQALAEDSGLLLQEYIARVGQAFAEHHPLAVVTDMHTEMNADGSATVVFEAVQPITPVMPLSERNTAEPME